MAPTGAVAAIPQGRRYNRQYKQLTIWYMVLKRTVALNQQASSTTIKVPKGTVDTKREGQRYNQNKTST